MPKPRLPLLTRMMLLLTGLLAVGTLSQVHASTGGQAAVASELSRTLVMDNGRIKPMESYARYTLLGFSGHSRGGRAIGWLCRVLFAPDAAAKDKIFLVNNPAIADALRLPVEKRFSAASIAPALGRLDSLAQPLFMTDPKERSPVDNELLRLDLNVREYSALTGGRAFGELLAGSAGSTGAPAVIPFVHNGTVNWTDPVSARSREFDTSGCGLARLFGSAASAYAAGRFDDCAGNLRSFNGRVSRLLASENIRIAAGIEILYDQLDPFLWTRIAYLLGLFLLCIGLFGGRRAWPVSGTAAVAAGLVLHTLGLVLRTMIMHRPPIASFYETFITVGWIGVVLGLLVAAFMKNRYGLFVAAFMGAAFLSLSSRFGADGDTLGMLAPVLNSNFWLTSHILTITTGFAGCVAAGVVGHIYLIRRLFLRQEAEKLNQIDQLMRVLIAVGLTFTTIGTVLGGMWAEQAWGRFWGWDPKENGALLIIVWCAIIMHSRAGNLVRETGAAAGAVILLALVMLAWIGVNLLGVGMHSYGFTVIGAKALAGIIGGETAFLVAAGILRVVSRKKWSVVG